MIRSRRLPAYSRPLPCHILAVDPARTSGWALVAYGSLGDWGTLRDTDQVGAMAVVDKAARYSDNAGQPLVVVGETWGRGGNRGLAQWQGLGAAWGAWRSAVERLAPEHKSLAKSRVVRVHTSTWRSTFGLCRLTSAQAKASAVRLVGQRYRIALEPEQHDAAEAILIGAWASRAGVVGAKLPKRLMQRWEGAS